MPSCSEFSGSREDRQEVYLRPGTAAISLIGHSEPWCSDPLQHLFTFALCAWYRSYIYTPVCYYFLYEKWAIIRSLMYLVSFECASYVLWGWSIIYVSYHLSDRVPILSGVLTTSSVCLLLDVPYLSDWFRELCIKIHQIHYCELWKWFIEIYAFS